MKYFRRILFGLMMLGLAFTSNAQTFETGGVVGAEYDIKIMKGWHWNAETQLRFNQNFTHYGRWKLTVGTDYTFWKKHIKIGASYALMNYQDDEGIFDWRHRITGSLTLTQKWPDVKISYRAAFQSTFRDERRGDYTFNPKTYMRNRLKVSFDMPNSSVKMYLSEEFWWRLYHPEKNIIDNLRTMVGVEYDINKHNSLDFFLRSDNEVQVSNPTHILYFGIAYNYN